MSMLPNLYDIYWSMIKHYPEEVTVIGFGFTYNKCKYNVILKLLDHRYNNKYDMALEFSHKTKKDFDLDKDWLIFFADHRDGYLAYKDGRKYISDPYYIGGKLYDFFGSSTHRNGPLTSYFCKCLNKVIPINVPDNDDYDSNLKSDILTSLSHNNNENPLAIYCIGLKRNKKIRKDNKQSRRTYSNGEKASILVPTLYKKITYRTRKHGFDISFLFSEDKSKQKCEKDPEKNQNKILNSLNPKSNNKK